MFRSDAFEEKYKKLLKSLIEADEKDGGLLDGTSDELCVVRSGEDGNTRQKNPVQMRFDFGPEFGPDESIYPE